MIHEKYEKGKVEGRAEGRAEGEAIGEARGEANSRIEIAKKMLQRGLSIEMVVEDTGLAREVVEGIYLQRSRE